MTKKRNISAMIAFCVLVAGFVVMNWLDSEYMWDTLMGVRYREPWQAWWNRNGGFRSFLIIIYRIGDMETVYSIFTSFPGCFFTVLPLLAVVFTVMKKKIPAGIFAVLNLLFSALIIVLSVVYNGEANASWIAYAVASVVLMLFALRVIRRKTLTGRLCFSLGIVAAVVSVMLSADIDWYRFFMTLPGVLFAAFPLLAVGFAGKRKKIPAVIFAALNLLFTGSTVKVDGSDRLKNLREIAKRAVADNDAEAAVKYYDMILVEEPNNWAGRPRLPELCERAGERGLLRGL